MISHDVILKGYLMLFIISPLICYHFYINYIIFLSIYLPIYLSICLPYSTYLPFYLLIHPNIKHHSVFHGPINIQGLYKSHLTIIPLSFIHLSPSIHPSSSSLNTFLNAHSPIFISDSLVITQVISFCNLEMSFLISFLACDFSWI